jgi:hypothetical protein
MGKQRERAGGAESIKRTPWRRLLLCRSARWQTAGDATSQRWADCQSATQQVANLRYGGAAVHGESPLPIFSHGLGP